MQRFVHWATTWATATELQVKNQSSLSITAEDVSYCIRATFVWFRADEHCLGHIPASADARTFTITSTYPMVGEVPLFELDWMLRAECRRLCQSHIAWYRIVHCIETSVYLDTPELKQIWKIRTEVRHPPPRSTHQKIVTQINSFIWGKKRKKEKEEKVYLGKT